MRHWIYLLISLLFIPGGWAGSSDKKPTLTATWPLVGNPSLSSSFGEYRNGHLHAGIDIRTGGRDGVACRAVADGYISRLRASPYGYGKALYLRLPGGWTAVYAHLSEFSPSIEDWLFEEQVRLGKYQVDLYPDSERFPVRKGDIIAYSGSTGAGAPHLHFEIRDELERPMNPLTKGWTLPDDLRPVIDRIVWMPLGKSGRINGDAFPLETKTDKLGEGRFSCPDTVLLSGPVGLAARIFDRHNGASGRLAPCGVELYIDGEWRADFAMNSFSFKQGVEVELIYEMERVLDRREYFLILFSREGQTVWNRWFSKGGRIIPSMNTDGIYADANPPAGGSSGEPDSGRYHTVEIHAMDCFGNKSVLSATFAVADGNSGGPESILRNHAANARADDPDGKIPALFLFDDLLSVRPDLLGDGGLSRLVAALRETPEIGRESELHDPMEPFTASCEDFDTSLIALPPSPGVGDHPLYLIPVQGKAIEPLNVAELGASVSVPGEALYGHGFVFLSQWDGTYKKLESQEELLLRSKMIRIGPLSLAVRSFLEVSFLSGEPWSGKEAVYQLNERKGEWSFRPSLTEGESISAHVHRPGVYAVLSDRTAPRIGAPEIRKHRMHADGRIFPEIVIPIVDEGAGLDADNTRILIDGVEQIARWDGFSKKSFVLLRGQNIIGTRGLTVIALDHAGNESQLQTSLTITRDYFSDSDKRNGENVE